MRLLNYIKEEAIDYEMIYNKIRKDCLGFIKDTDKRPLFRGIRTPDKEMIMKKTPRTDRIPKDTPVKVSNMVDDALYKKFGWKPRSEGVFVSSSCHTAEHYGDPFYFLPIGPYKYIWSTKVADLYADINYEFKTKTGKPISNINIKGHEDMVEAYIKEYVDSCLDRNISNAITFSKEIMFKCSSYYLINAELSWTNIMDKL